MATSVFKAVEALAAEREAMRRREEKMVAGLREILGRLGYRLEAVGANGSARRRNRRVRRRAATSGSGSVTCSVCGRTFSLPLHLGRHMSMAHERTPADIQTTVPAAGEGSGTAPGAKPAGQPRRGPASRKGAGRPTKAAGRGSRTARPRPARAPRRRRAPAAKAARQSQGPNAARPPQPTAT